MKKSFILHNDSLSVLFELTDEQAGKLFKAIALFQTGEETELDILTKVAFAPFKSQFNRDAETYELVSEKRREAGAKGGKQKVANVASATNRKQKVANVADSDNKNDSDSGSKKENEKETIPFESFWDIYPKKVDKKKSEEKWNRLTFEKQTLAIADLPIRTSKHKTWIEGFILDPTTYINGERWNDEIITPQIAKPTQTKEPEIPFYRREYDAQMTDTEYKLKKQSEYASN